jgi:isopropylmalate/homocitrate/citramalate synthase
MQHGREFQKKWFVSPYNFSETVTPMMKFPEKVELYDVTLREGEQHIGVSFTKEQKITLIRKMAEARIPYVEVSLVAASKDDQEVITQMSQEDLGGTTLTALCRLMKPDVDLAADCGLRYIGVITMINETNLVSHNWTEEHVFEEMRDVLSYAKTKGFAHIAMMIPDATKLPKERLIKMLKVAEPYIASACLNDTFSSLSPHGAMALADEIQAASPIPLHLHCHNDFGMAAANSIAAASRGIKYIQGSFLGIGEKTGNAPMEELVAGLEMLYGVDTGVDMTKIGAISELVSEYTEIRPQSNTPVIGTGVRACVSPTAVAQQARLAKTPEDWEKWGPWIMPFVPSALGISDEPDIVLGKTSGAVNVGWYLDKWGVSLEKEQVRTVVNALKDFAVKKGGGRVTEDELHHIVEELGFC